MKNRGNDEKSSIAKQQKKEENDNKLSIGAQEHKT
jgi:hypothetical protein